MILEFSWKKKTPQYLKPNFLELLQAKKYPLGFLKTPDSSQLRNLRHFVAGKKGIKNYCLLGIGGSATPTRNLHQFFGKPCWNDLDSRARGGAPRFWVLDSIDEPIVAATLARLNLNPRKTLFHVVSKSGKTLEVDLLKQRVTKALRLKSPREWSKQFVITTSPGQGNPLSYWARAHNIPCFELGQDIGGRFSTFSSVTYLWASFLGLNLEGFAKGSEWILKNLEWPMLYAEQLHQQIQKKKTILGIFLYGNAIAGFGDFLSQLFAESLGKDGRGITPLPFIGTRDQHSVLQLFLDGPKDKQVTLLRMAASPSLRHVGRGSGMPRALQAESPKGELDRVFWANMQGVTQALDNRRVPNLTIAVDERSEIAFAALVQFFHVAVSALGTLLRVNAFDQPMVELQKRYTKEFLRSPKNS